MLFCLLELCRYLSTEILKPDDFRTFDYLGAGEKNQQLSTYVATAEDLGLFPWHVCELAHILEDQMPSSDFCRYLH